MERLPRPGILLALVFAVAMVPYVPSLSGPFLIDDVELIEENAAVWDFSQAEGWFNEFYPVEADRAAAGFTQMHYVRPLVLLSYAVNWQMGGGDVLPFHLTNLLLHGLASSLVFLTLRRWLQLRDFAALLGAMLFAVHPIQTESVAWISGRTDSLLMIGLTLALWGQELLRRGRLFGVAAVVTGVAVAFASKETAVVLCGLSAIQALARPSRKRQEWFVVGGLFALCVAYLAARWLWLPVQPEGVRSLSFQEHLTLFLSTTGHYLRVLFYPADLSFYQGHIRQGVVAPGATTHWIVGAIAGLLFLMALVWAWKRRARGVFCSLAAAGALLAPVLQLAPMHSNIQFSIHLASPSLLGWGGLFGLGVVTLGKRLKGAPELGAAILVAAAILTWARSGEWGDARRFWMTEVAARPANPTVAFQSAMFEVAQGQRMSAFRRLACGYEQAVSGGRQEDAPLLLLASIRNAEDLVRESRKEELPQLTTFLSRVLNRQEAELKLRGSLLKFGTEEVEKKLVAIVVPQLEASFARLLARLAHRNAAPAARGSVQRCPSCPAVRRSAARVLMLAGEDENAIRLMKEGGLFSAPFLGRASFAQFVAEAKSYSGRALAAQQRQDNAEADRWWMERYRLLQAPREVVLFLQRRPSLVDGIDEALAQQLVGFATRTGNTELAKEIAHKVGSDSDARQWLADARRQFGPGRPLEALVPGGCATRQELSF